MELKNVATFIKVAEIGNFTKAAYELGYSQAAVTVQIKHLENELGTLLFDRLGKSISLTDSGRAFLPYAYRVLEAEEEARNSIHNSAELSGELRIGASSSTSMGKLPGLITRLVQAHPKIHVIVRTSDYIDDLVLKLKRGELDLLYLVDERSTYADFRIVSETQEQVAFVTNSDNPLAASGKLSLAELASTPLITSDRDSSYTMYLMQKYKQLDIDFTPSIEMSSVRAIADILLSGFGTSFIPVFMADPWIRSGELTILDTEDPGIEIWSQLICHKDKWISPEIQAFIDLSRVS